MYLLSKYNLMLYIIHKFFIKSIEKNTITKNILTI
nr:MAG TPA: hypothetical protein [Caudoviricetes sp.]